MRGNRLRQVSTVCDSRLLTVLFLLLIAGVATGSDRPFAIDTSSPRATLQSFLALTDEAVTRYHAYRDAPSGATQRALEQTASRAERLLDLRGIPPAIRSQVADKTFYLIWEIIARHPLPDPGLIPDVTADQSASDEYGQTARWRLPQTELRIVRISDGPYAGEYQFSADTVRNAPAFYEVVSQLPYVQAVGIPNARRTHELFTGWLIPQAWVESLPDWANHPVGGMVAWKWIAVPVVLIVEAGILVIAYRWGRRKRHDSSLGSYLRYISAPLAFLALIPLASHLVLDQLHITGWLAEVWPTLAYLAYGATLVWVVWLSANQIAERIIASPKVAAESLDASLLRLIARAIALVAILLVLFKVLGMLGVPVAGLITGAGVGGVAIALAAKSTLENFMGALNLFADRPVRVGDLCRYDEDSRPGWRPVGTVEAIGLRSTQIRRFDRTLITIPNADFAQRTLVNLSAGDRFLLATQLGLRYETTDDQMRFVLAQLRELLHAHPRAIHTAADPIRVRFVGFGDFSLDIAIRAYIDTRQYNEFLAIQEDILLRVMKTIDDAGTGFAFPTSTLYLGRDGGIDKERQQSAEKQVREWGSAQTLPFPDFTEDYRQRISDTLDYPPEGSPDADRG